MTTSDKPVPPFDVVPNKRLEPGVTFALVSVSTGAVTVVKDDGTQEKLAGTKLARFRRWTMREGSRAR